jgi:broad specificity phosphatase PhoE
MRVVIPPEFPVREQGEPAPEPETSSGSGSRVWLVRHAEVHADWQKRAYGNMDVPLSARGEEQTRALCSAFTGARIARVTSSNLARALAMGQGIAAATGAELVVDDRLREIWRGAWQGLPAEEFRARWEADRDAFLAHPWTWKPHGGESDADVFARAWPVVRGACEQARGGEVVLTTHYNVIRVLVTRALGLKPHESFSFQNDPAHATLLVDAQHGWVLSASNADGPCTARAATPSGRARSDHPRGPGHPRGSGAQRGSGT